MLILNDFQTSIIKAFDEIDKNWRNYQGLVIAGTHTPHDVEMMIDKIREARKIARLLWRMFWLADGGD